MHRKVHAVEKWVLGEEQPDTLVTQPIPTGLARSRAACSRVLVGMADESNDDDLPRLVTSSSSDAEEA